MSATFVIGVVSYGFMEYDVTSLHIYGIALTLVALVMILPTLVYAWMVPEV